MKIREKPKAAKGRSKTKGGAKSKSKPKRKATKSGKGKRTAAIKMQPGEKEAYGAPKSGESATSTLVMTTLTAGAVGVMGYFGWQWYKKKRDAKKNQSAEDLVQLPAPEETTKDSHSGGKKIVSDNPAADTTGSGWGGKKATSSSSGADFPLKRGSKGDNVRRLQQALIDKYGSGALPKYGADSDFGSETVNALKKNGLPTVVSESTFNVLTQGSGNASSGASALAAKLYSAAQERNLNTVLALLKNITGKDDYQQVSDSFLQHRLNGVRQTLVNGLLGSFHNESQKQKIRLEFLRMGLQYDGNKWSLSGFDGQAIVTTEAASVWVTATQSVPVPSGMVLGHEVTKRLDFTLFENNNKYFLIKTASVRYL